MKLIRSFLIWVIVLKTMSSAQGDWLHVITDTGEDPFQIDRIAKITFESDHLVLHGVGEQYSYANLKKMVLPIDTATSLTMHSRTFKECYEFSVTNNAVKVTTREPARISVKAFDMRGRLMHALFEGRFAGGSLILPISTQKTASQPFLISLSVNGVQNVHKTTPIGGRR